MCDRNYKSSRQLFQEETLSVTDSIAHFAGIRNTCLSGEMAWNSGLQGPAARRDGPGECGGSSWTERQKSFARPGKTTPMALLRSA